MQSRNGTWSTPDDDDDKQDVVDVNLSREVFYAFN